MSDRGSGLSDSLRSPDIAPSRHHRDTERSRRYDASRYQTDALDAVLAPGYDRNQSSQRDHSYPISAGRSAHSPRSDMGASPTPRSMYGGVLSSPDEQAQSAHFRDYASRPTAGHGSQQSVQPEFATSDRQNRSLESFGLLSLASRPPSSLAELWQAAISAEKSSFRQLALLLKKNRLAHLNDESTFLREAAAAYRSGNVAYADGCVRAATIIHERKSRTRSELEDYLDDVFDGNQNMLRDLNQRFTTVKEAVLRRIPQPLSGQGPTSRTSDVVGPTMPSPYGVAANTTIGRDVSQQRHTSVSVEHTSNPGRHVGPSQRSDSSQSRPMNRSADGENELLDSRYRVMPSNFFKVGRVFATLWHEAAGASGRMPGRQSDFLENSRFGELIFSHIRRMVVVRADHGSSWCISLNAYAGKGLAKRGFDRRDIEAHAIVYESDREPYTAADEPDLRKDPIAIQMAGPDQRLDKMARLNFGKVYTVEHNVKVMNVGMIAPRSMDDFEQYWREEATAKRDRR